MIEQRRKFKSLLTYIGVYSLTISIIIGLRFLHHMPIDWHYYAIISAVIFLFLVIFSFVEPQHIEKILPKNSTISFIVVLTFRFLPLAKQKITNIKNNQEMRGAKFRGFDLLKNYLSLAVPAIVVSLRWSDNIIEGIKLRGGE